MSHQHKEFGPTSWSIDNKTSIYFITILITLFGISLYFSLPKTNFPDIVIPTIYVSTIYPGTSPADMENLVTRPIEKQCKSIPGVKKITSNSIQDFANVVVEFNTDVDVPVAKQRVKDAVDKARQDLPKDLPADPNVIEVDFSEIPIMNINISGDYDLNRLKTYAEAIQDEVEQLKEITRADMVGALDREIQVNVDMYKMQAANLTFGDIERAIAYENMTISGGAVDVGNMKRALRVKGTFTNPMQLQNIAIKNSSGLPVYLKDVADVKDSFKERESYARYNGKNVITLNVIKRSGENLINASDKIHALIENMEVEKLPKDLKVDITADQSEQTRTTLNDLINSIIIGFILVTIVLMFFMGVTNAFFVALSVPLSTFMAFMLMPWIGFELNMIVLFALLFALGIVVDDAIVVIENTYRIFDNGKVPVGEAAKKAAGEIFVPVFAGTLTTLAPFVPLAFWQGIVGKFMFYLPITLIITLVASLIVAFIINPVFAVTFMSIENKNPSAKEKRDTLIKNAITVGIMAFFTLIAYIAMPKGYGNFAAFALIMFIAYKLFIKRLLHGFEYGLLPKLMDAYESVLTFLMRGVKPYLVLAFTIVLLFFSIFMIGQRPPAVEFFPQGDPNFIYAYLTLPVGTNTAHTDSITAMVEQKVEKVVGKNNPIVESIGSNVAVGAVDPNGGDRSTAPNKGKVTVAFVKFAERGGKSTREYLDKIRTEVSNLPGVQVTVAQEQGGPPTGAPINIEVSGENIDELIAMAGKLKYYLQDSLQIPGIEELKSDFVNNNPEIIVNVNREKANREGVATAFIGGELRTAVFGKEVSKFKDNEDEFPIQLRYQFDQRNSVDALLNTKLTFRNEMGQMKSIPLSAVADVQYTNTYGGIKRKNLKRVITLASNVLSGYNATEINEQIKAAVAQYNLPRGIEVDLTGEQEEQAETSAFLGRALLISLGLIFLILITQFNSVSKTVIILSEIVFSIIGVLLGFAFFQFKISIVMVGIGIVGLAGIVVKNGILIVEFADVLREQGYSVFDAVVHAGRTRIKPVLLTASATTLGLIPLALGMNINFVTLFTDLDPQFFLGGDSVVFWGPLSWTIIFGLTFATFLTLVVVPAMYLIRYTLGERFSKKKNLPDNLTLNTSTPTNNEA
ncbi:MAG: efflux RND transporter permease subunit [Chitinophagales bacterium]|nr:efflux RND transporter permease subunit [Sphingobacteriales bacterium]MBP7533619.1 efflux RND transporter permease subunit [Chitinophagales bacterium]